MKSVELIKTADTRRANAGTASKAAKTEKKPLLVALEVVEDGGPLSDREKRSLERYEGMIAAAAVKVVEGFREMAEALYQIRKHRLYRETHSSFAAYAR